MYKVDVPADTIIEPGMRKVIPFYPRFRVGRIVKMAKTGRIGFISKLPTAEQPVYTLKGKSGTWSALPNQFYVLNPAGILPPVKPKPAAFPNEITCQYWVWGGVL